jgi:hypothetical protein
MLKKKFAAAALIAVPMLVLSGCSKPEQSEVRQGLVTIFKDTVGSSVDDATINKIADCVAPQIMDMDKATLDAIADGEDKATTDDASELKTITTKCLQEATGQ